MKQLILFLLLFLLVVPMYGQVIEGVKHIEIVSEIQDTMALLNKKDIDKINQVFFEREKLDSLNKVNEDLVMVYQAKCLQLLQISDLKDGIIKDKDLLIDETKTSLEAKYEDQKLETKKMRNKKLIWQGISIAEIAIFLIIIL